MFVKEVLRESKKGFGVFVELLPLSSCLFGKEGGFLWIGGKFCIIQLSVHKHIVQVCVELKTDVMSCLGELSEFLKIEFISWASRPSCLKKLSLHIDSLHNISVGLGFGRIFWILLEWNVHEGFIHECRAHKHHINIVFPCLFRTPFPRDKKGCFSKHVDDVVCSHLFFCGDGNWLCLFLLYFDKTSLVVYFIGFTGCFILLHHSCLHLGFKSLEVGSCICSV